MSLKLKSIRLRPEEKRQPLAAGGVTNKTNLTKGPVIQQKNEPILRKKLIRGFEIRKPLPTPLAHDILDPLRRSSDPARPCLSSNRILYFGLEDLRPASWKTYAQLRGYWPEDPCAAF